MCATGTRSERPMVAPSTVVIVSPCTRTSGRPAPRAADAEVPRSRADERAHRLAAHPGMSELTRRSRPRAPAREPEIGLAETELLEERRDLLHLLARRREQVGMTALVEAEQHGRQLDQLARRAEDDEDHSARDPARASSEARATCRVPCPSGVERRHGRERRDLATRSACVQPVRRGRRGRIAASAGRTRAPDGGAAASATAALSGKNATTAGKKRDSGVPWPSTKTDSAVNGVPEEARERSCAASRCTRTAARCGCAPRGDGTQDRRVVVGAARGPRSATGSAANASSKQRLAARGSTSSPSGTGRSPLRRSSSSSDRRSSRAMRARRGAPERRRAPSRIRRGRGRSTRARPRPRVRERSAGHRARAARVRRGAARAPRSRLPPRAGARRAARRSAGAGREPAVGRRAHVAPPPRCRRSIRRRRRRPPPTNRSARPRRRAHRSSPEGGRPR